MKWLAKEIVGFTFGPGLQGGGAHRSGEGHGDLQVVADAQVAVQVEEGRRDVAADGALFGLARPQVHRIDVSSERACESGENVRFSLFG